MDSEIEKIAKMHGGRPLQPNSFTFLSRDAVFDCVSEIDQWASSTVPLTIAGQTLRIYPIGGVAL